MALIHQLVLRADNGLCHTAKGKERHRDTARGKRARLRGWVRKVEREKKRQREKEREGGGGGVFMVVVFENVETLCLLWTSIQWKEHDGKSALAVTGLLYKSWGVTPTLFWHQILMSVWLCWTFKPFSLVSSTFTTGNAIQVPFPLVCSYLRLQALYSTTVYTVHAWKTARFPPVMVIL